MKRPAWMDGPLFDLKPSAQFSWYWMVAVILGSTLAVVIKGDLWLMAAMLPGVMLPTANLLLTDPRYRKEADHESNR